ncbi:peptide-methionine (S)-S-oxide reductase MsrA [Senegalia massiliensis]|uniref:peptide-methionine (S)-S-oxide reductase MsrA n=1 Tax=Senegalia massiliensis TaxID=1720316 RepID=UPI001031FBC0|nr:peptide-methionine (S)-S-oxide reductase MsrA [Senegalia massiliensis]
MKKIVLAGGCFWGVEEYISRINGVIDTEVGYANGRRKNPTYEQVCTGTTGHSEAVKVEYDQNSLSLYSLLKKFFSIIDPTIENRQGPDRGTQYRTGIYYINENDKDTILKVVQEEQKKYDKKIVTEIEPLNSFFEAEEYHQDYLKKNPNGYCHIDLS